MDSMKIVWLSTQTMLLACHSLANACFRGAPGDFIYQHDREANLMAGKPSHKIFATRTGGKRVIRIYYSPT